MSYHRTRLRRGDILSMHKNCHHEGISNYFLLCSYLMKLAVLLVLNRKTDSCYQDFFKLEVSIAGVDLKLSLERRSFDTWVGILNGTIKASSGEIYSACNSTVHWLQPLHTSFSLRSTTYLILLTTYLNLLTMCLILLGLGLRCTVFTTAHKNTSRHRVWFKDVIVSILTYTRNSIYFFTCTLKAE